MHRRTVLAGLIATLACAAPLAAQSPGPAAESRAADSRLPPPASRVLKVLTFNIHHAEGEDGTLDVARVAQVIRDAGADIVGLQEVDRGAERTGRRDLLKEIADLAGLRFAFGKNLDLQGGDYGNALLTRFPIVSEGNRALPVIGGGEPRGVLQVVLDVEGTQVLVLTTHLDHRRPDPQRVASAEAMLEMLQAWGDRPAIALGDFNDVPGSETYRILTSGQRAPGTGHGEPGAGNRAPGTGHGEPGAGNRAPGTGQRASDSGHREGSAGRGGLVDVWAAVGKGDGFTIPVEAPSKRIDWILVRGFEPVAAEVPRTEASDHLPVAATLRFR
ncbi:metal-dependent hydrolase [Luteitalea sp. TBR-22]|uniref:endonuclease/exonuclease/phosphatase family protein n=1 Tax=Luteitalea sp. TBR-22 TaxID=2802971 RepID=UPI001AF7F869|nr:endonuclease/exonuclease/phosphatase family protein [Luteitalea sp. TBR-22]BCS35863.1 metal-dependent hydrolase [Luteitalea sp. TBR-22]